MAPRGERQHKGYYRTLRERRTPGPLRRFPVHCLDRIQQMAFWMFKKAHHGVK